MKATELIIGDWVYFGKDDYSPSKIDGILPYDEGIVLDFDNEPVSNDNIHPIPLTPELLTDNGWKRHNGYYRRWWDFNDGPLHIEMDDQNINIWRDYDGESYSDYLLPTPNYVHELQHIFRLCGLTDNFTVKNE